MTTQNSNPLFFHRIIGKDIFDTAQGAGQGDSGAGADAAVILAESSTARNANTGGGDEGSASVASLATTSCSKFHSARIASMLSSRSEFETELEYRTAHSKVLWSELSHHEQASSSEESRSGSGEAGTGRGDQFGVDHSQYFEELQKDAIWGKFCSEVADVVLGREVGQGAQGVIYDAQVTFATVTDEFTEAIEMERVCVVKVMKSGYALEDLHRQWPRGLAALKDSDNWKREMFPLYGALVKDPASGRNQFGFVMRKHWGDLRRLIDLRMERNNAKGPPFSNSTEQALELILQIAAHMALLHELGIIHRDLKAANVLVSPSRDEENFDLVSSNDNDKISTHVADWECSVGVVGTGFWRAPEILRQLKEGTPASEIVFTKEMDVYSFAMTCYEIVTGLLPFEGLPFYETRDAILAGARPQLPHDMDPFTKVIIILCWDPNPMTRPSFEDVGGTIFRYIL